MLIKINENICSNLSLFTVACCIGPKLISRQEPQQCGRPGLLAANESVAFSFRDLYLNPSRSSTDNGISATGLAIKSCL